ncbi:extensin [Iris pallida]|uniref:Extensin n=1 Tax=Iris pallida TaxID=29817 RepID=A0AAX6GF19_IRIPA|nr:extensin [Iris pallida]
MRAVPCTEIHGQPSPLPSRCRATDPESSPCRFRHRPRRGRDRCVRQRPPQSPCAPSHRCDRQSPAPLVSRPGDLSRPSSLHPCSNPTAHAVLVSHVESSSAATSSTIAAAAALSSNASPRSALRRSGPHRRHVLAVEPAPRRGFPPCSTSGGSSSAERRTKPSPPCRRSPWLSVASLSFGRYGDTCRQKPRIR